MLRERELLPGEESLRKRLRLAQPKRGEVSEGPQSNLLIPIRRYQALYKEMFFHHNNSKAVKRVALRACTILILEVFNIQLDIGLSSLV